MSFRIIGVHRVPVEMFGDDERPPDEDQWPYLFEVELPVAFEATNWGEFTQGTDGLPRGSWQAVKDEQRIEGTNRALFFFHCVQWDKPLSTPFGEAAIPEPGEMPDRFKKTLTYYWD